MWFASAFACSLIFLVNSSKCPEPRKPHLTSCTIFYNCVNLPNSGYVWVPSKCTEGLVFQPYLRMCVVPGDIWTCDTLSTESSLITKRYETPELINPMNTSYLEYTQDPLEFSETIDSSYTTDDISDSITEEATPYPLIEFEKADGTHNVTHEDIRNIYHEEKNYLHKYINNQRFVPLPLMQKYKDVISNHYKLVQELMSRLHIYQELSAIISDSLPVSTEDITTGNPSHIVKILAAQNQKRNISLNYLVQSYIEDNKLHSDKVIETDENHRPQTDNIPIVSTKNPLELLINGLDSDNNIIRINDSYGNKQYLTMERYKATAYQLISQTISVVSCTKNVRLPNRTDCTKYYTCDPKTAFVVEYSCPLHTAFNIYTRVCDIESHKMCENSKESLSDEIFLDNVEHGSTTHSENLLKEKLCQEFGKIKDPMSHSHYYICYSAPGSEDIKSIRMTCPNTLIFCQNKKLCTTKRLCKIS